jgi:sulfate transport system ATP-binding protein
MFTLRSVIKSYNGTKVFGNVSCEIPTDRFVFVLGASGSGKSTLLRMLSFVETPDTGRVELALDGARYASDTLERPWPKLTCVFQRQFLWPHLTIRENILLPLRYLSGKDIETKLTEVTNLFGMSAFLDRHPNEVSGGEAQRAALARAFVLDPKVMLIDEVHGGLDLEQQSIVNGHLLALHNRGVGLVVVTHSLLFAEKYADVALIVENGAITPVGDSRGLRESSESPFLRRVRAL